MQDPERFHRQFSRPLLSGQRLEIASTNPQADGECFALRRATTKRVRPDLRQEAQALADQAQVP